MSDEITLENAKGTWVIRAGGAVLGESSNAILLTEEGNEPVVYFPKSDLAMAFLEPSDTQSSCPTKGQANYFSIQTKSTLIKDAAWSYADASGALKQIGDHVAFDGAKVAVENL